MTHPPRNIVKALLLAVFVLASVATVGCGTAAAKDAKTKPACWKTLINDWYDGRIDGTYEIQCYRDALKNLPADIETYSSARDDIRAALQKRLTQGTTPKGGGKTTTTTTTGGGGSGSNPSGGGKPGGSGPSGGGTTPNGGSKSPAKTAFGAGKGNADSFPVALIILSAIAGLLMVAGAAGYLTRRTRTRRVQLAAAAAKQPPQTP